MTPGVGPTGPGSSATPGTSASNQFAPMTSSYRGGEALPRVTARSRAAAAAAVMAQHQSLQARVLGVTNPGSSGRGYVSDGATGVFVPPALITNPQVTVNSSISSGPTAVVAAGSGGGGTVVNGAVAATSVAGTTGLGASIDAGTTVTTAGASSAAPLFPATGVPVTPASAGIPLTPGMFAGSSPIVAATAGEGALGISNALATPLNTTMTTATPSVSVDGGASVPTVAASTDGGTEVSTVANANVNLRRFQSGAPATLPSKSSATTVRALRNNGRIVITNDSQ